MKLDNLHMTANGPMVSVGWNDKDGNRLHVWLEVERDAVSHNDVRPLRPFRVRLERRMGRSIQERTIYRNRPPENRPRHGGRGTTYLNADAKAWQNVVAEALRRAEAEGLYEAALAANTAKEDEAKRRRDAKTLEGAREALTALATKTEDQNVRWNAEQLRDSDDGILLPIVRALRN